MITDSGLIRRRAISTTPACTMQIGRRSSSDRIAIGHWMRACAHAVLQIDTGHTLTPLTPESGHDDGRRDAHAAWACGPLFEMIIFINEVRDEVRRVDTMVDTQSQLTRHSKCHTHRRQTTEWQRPATWTAQSGASHRSHPTSQRQTDE